MSDTEIDLDGDGIADIVLKDTNGHTPYVNVKVLGKWAVGILTALFSAVISLAALL